MNGADSSIESGIDTGNGWRVLQEGRFWKLLGEPKLPPKLVRALFLLLFRACCFCLVTRSIRSRMFIKIPKLGIRSKRIALDADIALITE
ncbi:hypothetical protein AO726_10410 [Pseudomonas sp. TTU2014-080ASC]|nr:hypothetical protein AO726_10410 [Pseudomonas sp. TTU2014-080ASC]